MLTRCGVIFSGDSGQQQWAELLAHPEIMMINKQPTYIHSVLIQSLCFSLLVYVCSVTDVMSTLCNPRDWSPLGSSVHEILQARILERPAVSSSRASSWSRDWTRVCYVTCMSRPALYHECHLGSPTFSSVQFSSVAQSDSLRPHAAWQF